MGKQESEPPPTVFCPGISLWDKPCMIPAAKYCERVTAGSAKHTSGIRTGIPAQRKGNPE